MVVETLATVGLASNILQFIEFGCTLFAETQQIRTSITGTSDRYQELEKLSDRLKQLLEGIPATPAPVLGSKRPINDLANECVATANEVLKAINDVKLKGSHGNWKSFLHALQQVWKGRRIEKLAEKLSRLQTQLNMHLVVMMNDKHSEVVEELRRLYDIHKRMETNMPKDLASLRRDVLSAIQRSENASTTSFNFLRDSPGKVQPLMPISRLDMRGLSIVISELSEKLSDLQRNAQLAAETYKVLKSLQYKTMKSRESNIIDAHIATFEWIFSPNAETLESSMNFAEWLEHGSHPFWVFGKPGSGKSTFVKFLANHSRTNEMLNSWAGEKKLVTAKYFFWNAGNEMQKSKEGLLRSLLFEVLRQCPALIQPVCSWMPFYFALGDCADSPWSIDLLLECFSRLSQQTETSTKFCFFIDGLDEYEGDCFDLIHAIKKLSGCSAIKVCVSSRPWFVFKDAFGTSPERMIKLEDLTRNDIALYVRQKIEGHERFNVLCMKNDQYQELVQQIVDKADGVFLWVFLVTKSLLHGLTYADRISDLQRRISLLPDTLEKYFRHILATVEEVYSGQTAKTLRYALHAPPTGPIPLIVFSYLDEECPKFALKHHQRIMSNKDVSLREEDARRRLDGRTKGLLEVSQHPCHTGQPTVDFLHRTVRDFLLTKSMRAILDEDLEPGFDADVDLCKAYLAKMKLGPSSNPDGPMEDLENVIYYAHQVEVRIESPVLGVIDEVEKLTSEPSSAWNAIISEYGGFLGFVVDRNLVHYVKARLKSSPKAVHRSKLPLLHLAIQPSEPSRYGQQQLNVDMIRLLLSVGADPNQGIVPTPPGWTVWREFISTLHEGRIRGKADSTTLRRTLELLLAHGADPSIESRIKRPDHETYWNAKMHLTAAEILRMSVPNDAEWLLSKAAKWNFSMGGLWSSWLAGKLLR